MVKIGSFSLDSRVVLAPMAGVTDQPFRRLCRRFGAALTPSEMVTSNLKLWDSRKNRLRRIHSGEPEPRVIQIAGSNPRLMAEAARLNVVEGAQIIDINMGCPAKKVLKRSAGSALLQYPDLVRDILEAVVGAVDVPVTLKIRTGWDPEHRNGVDIARLAEDCGIAALAVHGRTRACLFRGEAEYDTIAAIKAAVSLPVFANGDITSPAQAAAVLDHTNADGIMIGRGAQGRPWLFREIRHFLDTGRHYPPIALSGMQRVVTGHLQRIHLFYGSSLGVLMARKHAAWYLQRLGDRLAGSDNASSQPDMGALRKAFNRLEDAGAQREFMARLFTGLTEDNKHIKELAA